jgi:peptide/nickel transport system substrate-binding protein
MATMTRRDLMQRAAALGLAGASMAAFGAAAATPRRGGHVKFGVSGGATSDSLDPRGDPDTHLSLTWWALRNSLTEVTEDGRLVGEAAESWESSPDATQWIFKIRKGAEFHNGKTLTAEDVVASLNLHRGADSKSAAKILVEPIVELKATDSQTVSMTLKGGNADFPYLMSDYHLLIMPSKDGKADWQSGIGTGGYTLERFEPGVSVRLKRFANYWKGEQRAHFDSVELLNIADSFARQNALMGGQVDAISRVEMKMASHIADMPAIRLIETTGAQYSTILMNTTQAPFNDLDVRLALKYAIDREQLLKTVLQDHGAIGNDQPIGPTYRYYDADLTQRSYDPDKAKFHLKKAGHDGLKLELQTAEVAWTGGAVDAAVLYAQQAKAAGIEIEVARKPNDGYWSDVWMKAPLCMGYVGGRPTEDWIFTSFYAADSEMNDTFWKNAQFEKLLLEGRVQLDDAKRRAIYREMQQILHDDGGLIAPLFSNHLVATKKNIGTAPKLSGNWEMDNWRAVERWWVV